MQALKIFFLMLTILSALKFLSNFILCKKDSPYSITNRLLKYSLIEISILIGLLSCISALNLEHRPIPFQPTSNEKVIYLKTGTKIALQSIENNKFTSLNTSTNYEVVADSSLIKDTCIFIVTNTSDNYIALKNDFNDLYLSVRKFKNPKVISSFAKDFRAWECFQIISHNDNVKKQQFVAIYSQATEKFITVDFNISQASPPLVARGEKIQQWELFNLYYFEEVSNEWKNYFIKN